MANNFREIEIHQYDDLINDKVRFNSWKEDDSFLTSNLNETQKKVLNNINILEVELKRTSSDNNDFDNMFERHHSITSDFIMKTDGLAYILLTERKPEPPRKIRSYKGILSKDIKEQSDYLQIENSMENGYSIILGMVKLSKENIDFCLRECFCEFSNCCILLANNSSVFSENFLKEFSRNHMIHKRSSIIDYCSLSISIIDTAIILRVGGDGGNRCVTLQSFLHKNQARNTIVMFQNIIFGENRSN